MITKFPSSFNSLGLEIPGPITSGELVHWGELQNFPLLTNSRALGPQLSVDAEVLLKGDPRELGRGGGALLSVKGGTIAGVQSLWMLLTAIPEVTPLPSAPIKVFQRWGPS